MRSRPPKKPGENEADEVDTTTNMSQASAKYNFREYYPNNRKSFEKMRMCQILGVSTIKEHEEIEELLLGDSKRQMLGRSTGMNDEDTETAPLTISTASSTWGCKFKPFPKIVRPTKFPALYRWIRMPKRRNLKFSKTLQKNGHRNWG